MKIKHGNVASIVAIVCIFAVTVGYIAWRIGGEREREVGFQEKGAVVQNESRDDAASKGQKQKVNSEDSFERDRYAAGTVHDIFLENSALVESAKSKKDAFVMDAKGADVPYKVKLVYKDKYRKIETNKKLFLTAWGKSLGIEKTSMDLYKNEVLVEENGEEYWLPIQEQLVPFLKKEVLPDTAVYFYIMWSGVYSDASSASHWVFVINEFDAE